MNSVFVSVVVFVLAAYFLYFYIVPYVRRLMRGKGVIYIPPKDLDAKIKSHEELVMIDIRNEFNDKLLGYINGAVSLPFAKFMNRIGEVSDSLAGFKEVPVVIIGIRDENEVFLAYKALKVRGFTDVCILDKGITQWLRVGLPTVRPNVSKDS